MLTVAIHREPLRVPGEVRFRETFRTTYADKNRMIDRAVQFIRDHLGLQGQDLFRIRLCIDEGIQNAMVHGNGEDTDRTVDLAVFEGTERWGIAITDEGKGFSPEDLPDPDDPEALLKETGRGILIMTRYMDEVSYFGGGRTLLLVKAKR